VENISIKLPDGSLLEAAKGTTVYDLIGKIGAGLQKAAVAAAIDGELVDLTYVVEKDASLTVHTFKDDTGQSIYWHSTSHILAQAVKRLYPDAKYAIGPSIDNGFYYDFDCKTSFTPDDLEKIEKEIEKILAEALSVKRTVLSCKDARSKFEKMGETYKVELIDDLETDTVTVYEQGEFSDLCRGPHIINTSVIGAVKLTKVAGAYWRGNEKNQMLQRIYGVSFPDKKQLKKHLDLLEEAKERDHRKIGKEMSLFEFSQDVGPGLTMWTPKGARIRTVIEDFWKKQHYRNGYDIVYTPHIGRSRLWEISGHLDFYKDGMYSAMDIDGEDYYVKPMNCPFHIILYKSEKRSYRDLPLRWAEFGTVYRYEKSGTLHGLLRVRGFTQDDAHLFIREDQLTEEISRTFKFMIFMLKSFGFEQFQVYLSTRPEKAVGSVEIWQKSEAALAESLKHLGVEYSLNEGDGAFYGPKIDVKVVDAIGRQWQLSTLQLDFNLPERFDMTYTGADGAEHRPIMIHRALLGSLERFFGILIEHYKGAFPAWLAPVQVMLLNVGEDVIDDVKRVRDHLRSEGIRVEMDLRNETMGYKIREAVTSKAPYVCVIGHKEVEEGSVSVRTRGSQKGVSMNIEDLIDDIKKQAV